MVTQSHSNGIYAHNEPYPSKFWYPFCFDAFYNAPACTIVGQDDPQYLIENFFEYDYWRIDTSKIDNKWYVDKRAHDEFEIRNKPEHYFAARFIVTYDNVPKRALTLFRFQEERVEEVITNGTAHMKYLPKSRPVDVI